MCLAVDFLSHAFSDMTILEQHFYTDAGVNLPVNNEQSKSESDMLEVKPKVELRNATDDVKANLQKINKDVVRLKISKSDSVINESCRKINRNKRHSIVFPTQDHDEQQKKLLNRRSLSAIPTKDASRIPISFKGVSKVMKRESTDTVCGSGELNTASNKTHITTTTKQKTESSVACFKSSLNSCNKENVQKSSGLPVLMR